MRKFDRVFPIANTLCTQLNWSQYKLLTINGGPVKGLVKSEITSDKILDLLKRESLSIREIRDALELNSTTGALKRTINELLSNQLIEMTIPGKPQSRLQKYRVCL